MELSINPRLKLFESFNNIYTMVILEYVLNGYIVKWNNDLRQSDIEAVLMTGNDHIDNIENYKYDLDWQVSNVTCVCERPLYRRTCTR